MNILIIYGIAIVEYLNKFWSLMIFKIPPFRMSKNEFHVECLEGISVCSFLKIPRSTKLVATGNSIHYEQKELSCNCILSLSSWNRGYEKLDRVMWFYGTFDLRATLFVLNKKCTVFKAKKVLTCWCSHPTFIEDHKNFVGHVIIHWVGTTLFISKQCL